MSLVEKTEGDKHTCKSCGLSYDETAGRIHGKFQCWQCLNVRQTIRRNLGSCDDLKDWTVEDTHLFFRSCGEKKDNKLSWATVRALLVKKLTERHLESFESTVAIEVLPMSVYLQRGWNKETVEKFDSEESAEYGETVYKVPVKTMSWKQAFETMNERILQSEKNVTKKRRLTTSTFPWLRV